MTIGFLFWLLMVLWLVFGILVPQWGIWSMTVLPGNLLLWIIIALLGWKVFGSMIRP
jgi:hypothetical protein